MTVKMPMGSPVKATARFIDGFRPMGRPVELLRADGKKVELQLHVSNTLPYDTQPFPCGDVFLTEKQRAAEIELDNPWAAPEHTLAESVPDAIESDLATRKAPRRPKWMVSEIVTEYPKKDDVVPDNVKKATSIVGGLLNASV